MLAARQWHVSTLLLFIIALVALFVLYFPFLSTLVTAWDTNEDYSHGYFIPFVSLYMIWSVRGQLANLKIKPSNAGMFLVIGGLGLLLIAKIGSELFLQRVSLIIVLLGLVLFLLGRDYFKLLKWPILYLIFMVPLPAIIWNKIAFPLQLFGSYLTEQIVRLLGIPIFRQGNVLHLAETTLEVVAACSGLRSLLTMLALSSLLVWMSSLPVGRRWVLLLSAVPAALIANIVRLTITAILASLYGSDVAQGFLHDFSGLLTFIVGFGLLLLSAKLLSLKQTN
ncbi:exosortase/archaeosortase family protein [Thermodesulfobacteriota bacterium]